MGKIFDIYYRPIKNYKRRSRLPLIIIFLTMIELATRWLERLSYNDKQADTIANRLEQTWLYRYQCPTIITYDWRN